MVLEAVEYLLSEGSDHTIQNSNKETAVDCLLKKYTSQELLNLAIQKGLPKLAELSVDAGANVNAQYKDGNTSLHFAARKGNLEIVEVLLSAGANVNLINRDKKFTSPLSEAVENNNLAVVQLLVGKGANIRFTASKDSNMVNMLHLSASNCNLKMMKFFIEEGLDVNETDFYDDTALHAVIKSSKNKKDKLAAVKLLLANDADISAIGDEEKTPLQVAEEKGNADIVDILRNKTMLQEELLDAIQKGDSERVKKAIDLEVGVGTKDRHGKTALYYAVKNGHQAALYNDAGERLLFLAAEKGDLELVKLLIEKEISVSNKNKDGKTDLELAKQGGHKDVEELLNLYESFFEAIENGNTEKVKECLAKGVCANSRKKYISNECGLYLIQTPLHVAAKFNHCDIVELLLKQPDTLIDESDNSHSTPLHTATSNGSIEAMQKLLEYRANIELASYRGRRCMHIAAINGNKEAVQVLLDRGADINAKVYKMGDTALHTAISHNRLDVVRLLLNNNANVNLESTFFTSRGKPETPLQRAAFIGNKEIVTLLKEAQPKSTVTETEINVPTSQQTGRG